MQIITQLGETLEILDFDWMGQGIAQPSTDTLLYVASFLKKNGLQASVLKKIVFPTDSDDSLSLKAWSILFSICPKLEEICLNNKRQTNTVIQALVDSRKLKQLKRLRLEELNGQTVDVLLKEVDLHLQDFKINWIERNVKPYKLERLINTFKNSLKVLALGSPEDHGQMQIAVPLMPALEKLGMSCVEESLIILSGMEFSKATPKLRTLFMTSDHRCLNWRQYLNFREGQPVQSLATVKFLTVGWLVRDPECCSYLGHLFPNLTHLTLDFPHRTFLKRVWVTWENVTHLQFYFHISKNNSDEIISGFPPAWRRKMSTLLHIRRAEWKQNSKEVGKLLPKIFEGVECPNNIVGIAKMKCTLRMHTALLGTIYLLFHLTGLRSLIIEETPPVNVELTDISSSVNLISDLSAYFVLSKLKDLQVLKVGRSAVS